MSVRQQLTLLLLLSIPSVLSQLSSIIMEYIDAAMVGHLGAESSAAIGLVASSLWLMFGLPMAFTNGFAVQVAHRVGAKDDDGARDVVRQSIIVALLFSFVHTALCLLICPYVPYWLGGTGKVAEMAKDYFFVFALMLPMFQLHSLSCAMLRCAGDMKVPSMVNILICVLDVVFNYVFIYILEMGVWGAAWGSWVAELIGTLIAFYFLICRNPKLRIIDDLKSRFREIAHHYMPTRTMLRTASGISAPLMSERIVLCGAQIMVTMIVAPLGTVAIAANALAVTAESLCYMPGFGIGDAATTLVGQAIGAKRRKLTHWFAWISVGLGMVVMSLMGVVMYFGAPVMMGVLSPVQEIISLGTEVLRIEAWAEPMFAAAIVSYGVFMGAGNTLPPCLMEMCSMWCVRIVLAWWLAPIYGLTGVWIAMCIELCFRGMIFLLRLYFGKWDKKLYETVSD
ncbi:MAG: MATE family efflux transporter [Paludibacteraceae bacterium]|nr:MATE family efflux transporter [Paludibacteraceae bacterium]